MEGASNKVNAQSMMQRAEGGSYKDTSSLASMAFPVDQQKFNTRSMMRRGTGTLVPTDGAKAKIVWEEQKF